MLRHVLRGLDGNGQRDRSDVEDEVLSWIEQRAASHKTSEAKVRVPPRGLPDEHSL